MQSQSKQQTKGAAQRTGRDPIVMASVASVALSWYYFYVKGDRQRGIFVGLWPPTLLAFASYFRQAELQTMLERGGASGVVTRVQEMLEQQQ
ncbi:hypothetical protein [Halomicrobium salinisoli]|uniref:hypothetical protein n=1 Tax=Halomicrobium salinisoli TaxID=2878391 RepID=UPI001CF057C4|nr:hypothetical protein [Halomicrobium salinisoli]